MGHVMSSLLDCAGDATHGRTERCRACGNGLSLQRPRLFLARLVHFGKRDGQVFCSDCLEEMLILRAADAR